MAKHGRQWWGGRLADGTTVVLSPTGNALMLGDSSSASGLAPRSRAPSGTTFRAWAATRSQVPFPYQRGGHTIGIRYGTLMATAALGAAMVLTSLWAIGGGDAIPDQGNLEEAVTIAAGTLIGALLLALIYLVEVFPLKRRGIQFIPMPEDDDQYLRYAHLAIISTPEWGALEEMAHQLSPSAASAATVHGFLWEAAGMKPTLDAGEIRVADRARLREMALLSRGL